MYSEIRLVHNYAPEQPGYFSDCLNHRFSEFYNILVRKMWDSFEKILSEPTVRRRLPHSYRRPGELAHYNPTFFKVQKVSAYANILERLYIYE